MNNMNGISNQLPFLVLSENNFNILSDIKNLYRQINSIQQQLNLLETKINNLNKKDEHISPNLSPTPMNNNSTYPIDNYII